MADDLGAILKAYRSIPDAVKKAARPALDKGADELVDRMQYLAPVGETGNLKKSIRKTPINDLAIRVEAGGPLTTREVRAGSGVEFDYALGQEFGTAEAPAQSFFVPTIRTLRQRVRRRVDRAIGKAIREMWND